MGTLMVLISIAPRSRARTLTGATSQSPSRDTRGMPYQGGRGMRDGGRRNGGMGRR